MSLSVISREIQRSYSLITVTKKLSFKRERTQDTILFFTYFYFYFLF